VLVYLESAAEQFCYHVDTCQYLMATDNVLKLITHQSGLPCHHWELFLQTHYHIPYITPVSLISVVPHSSQKHPLCLMESSHISLSIIFKADSKPAISNFLPWLRPSFCLERLLLYVCYQEAPIGLLFAIAKG